MQIHRTNFDNIMCVRLNRYKNSGARWLSHSSVSRCRVGINLLFCLATLSGLFWNLLCRARGDNSIAMSAYTLHSKLSGWGWWGCRYGDGTDCQFILFFSLDFVLPPMTILGWCELDRHHLHNRQFTRWNNVLCRVNFVGCWFFALFRPHPPRFERSIN